MRKIGLEHVQRTMSNMEIWMPADNQLWLSSKKSGAVAAGGLWPDFSGANLFTVSNLTGSAWVDPALGLATDGGGGSSTRIITCLALYLEAPCTLLFWHNRNNQSGFDTFNSGITGGADGFQFYDYHGQNTTTQHFGSYSIYWERYILMYAFRHYAWVNEGPGGVQRCYLNLGDQGAQTGSTMSSYQFHINAGQYNRFDDIMYFPRALSLAEITNIYNYSPGTRKNG